MTNLPESKTLNNINANAISEGPFDRICRAAFKPIDNSSVLIFRFCFGMVMATWAWDYLALGRVSAFFIQPKFHFTYFLLDWVQPLPGHGMTFLFVVMILLSVFIAVGFLYRYACILFLFGFVYIFLLDRTNYQNHYYLIVLISLWLPFLPLNANASVDANLKLVQRSSLAPRWVLWILQFHIGLPYVYGGIAKFDSDWLLGVPLSQLLRSKSDLLVLGNWMDFTEVAFALAWGGMLFDLFIVPMLIFKRTRWAGSILCLAFHISNSILFNIHIFPWFMICASTLFWEPSWPRSALTGQSQNLLPTTQTNIGYTNRSSLGICFLIALYALFHCTWPLRHYLYEGNTNWTERGHHFSWRMMLRGKVVVLGYAVKDSKTEKVSDGNPRLYINDEQSEKFGKDPEMILHFAHFLAAEHKAQTNNEAEVYALVYVSLNGRKPELMIDPNVDLAKQPRGFWRKTSFLMPQSEPLRNPAWDVPPERWREHLKLPTLQFLNK